jgi:hypothetical protein
MEPAQRQLSLADGQDTSWVMVNGKGDPGGRNCGSRRRL